MGLAGDAGLRQSSLPRAEFCRSARGEKTLRVQTRDIEAPADDASVPCQQGRGRAGKAPLGGLAISANDVGRGTFHPEKEYHQKHEGVPIWARAALGALAT